MVVLKKLIHQIIILIILSVIISCQNSDKKSDFVQFEKIDDDFFNDTIFFSTPQKIDFYTNDSLGFSDTLTRPFKKIISNCLIEDVNQKRFPFKICKASKIKDTTILDFSSINLSGQSLIVKIIDNKFIVKYFEGIPPQEFAIRDRLIKLDTSKKNSDKLIKGIVNVTISNGDSANNLINFKGPFYFSQ